MFDTERFVLLLLSFRWLLLVWSGVVVLPGNLHPVEQNTCRDGNEQTLHCTETKRGRQKRGHGDGEGEHSEDDYEGNDEPAESRSSSFPTSPQRREQYTVCFVSHAKTKISAVYTLLMMLKMWVCILSLPFWGWMKRHRTKVCLSLCAPKIVWPFRFKAINNTLKFSQAIT